MLHSPHHHPRLEVVIQSHFQYWANQKYSVSDFALLTVLVDFLETFHPDTMGIEKNGHLPHNFNITHVLMGI